MIASLLLNLLDPAQFPWDSKCLEVDEIAQMRRKASALLDVERPPDQFLRPLRFDRPCGYLGPVQVSEMNELQSESIYNCVHPSHRTTTKEGCRQCRDWSIAPGISRTMTVAELVPPSVSRSGPRVRSWSVGVVTAPRREATLEWCLDSIVRAGWERPHLFIDGLVRLPSRYGHLPVTWRERAIGAWPNTYLALLEMIQRDPAADAFLLFQDDACAYDRANLREYLEEILWPGDRPGIVSLFCSQAYNKTSPGWHTSSQPWVWGAQAFLFSSDAARDLVMSPEIFSHRWNGRYGGRVQVDVLIGQWAVRHDWPLWYPNPSLVQHVGNTSSIWEDARIAGWRRADWFAGDLETPFSQETSLTDFPEQQFPCRDEFRESYLRHLQIGRERMSHSRVVICGLCRDVRHFLPKIAARVERLGSLFRDYRVVLFENDSVDATLEFLLDWQTRNNRVTVLSERMNKARYPQMRSSDRSMQMAEYRNRYRDFVVQHYPDFDAVLVVDTDLAGGWSYDGLANTFGHDDWDFVGSSGLRRINDERGSDWSQFDVWAFRAMGHPEPHSPTEIGCTLFERGEPLIPVLSCFGGLGVYRMQAVISGQYGGPDMEHAVFHEQLRANGFPRLYLNPSQITLYTPE